MALRIKKFDPRTFTAGKIIFLLGRRASGKSHLMKELLYYMSKPDLVVAMSPTRDSLNTFETFLPKTCIFDRFSQHVVDTIVTVQRELVKKNKKRTVLLILDDCIYQKGVLKSESMRYILWNGRHDHISLMCIVQYMMEVECGLRGNIDYVFAMREFAKNNREKLYKHFFCHFDKFDIFDKVMTACTENYKCLVLDTTVKSAVATDTVKWYKAAIETPPFKLCKSVYWKMSKKCLLSSDDIDRRNASFSASMSSADVYNDGIGGGGTSKKCQLVLVEIEDEEGNVVR